MMVHPVYAHRALWTFKCPCVKIGLSIIPNVAKNTMDWNTIVNIEIVYTSNGISWMWISVVFKGVNDDGIGCSTYQMNV